MKEPDLFSTLDVDVEEPDAPLTLAQRFERFDAANPRVFQTLRELAYEWIEQTGRRKLAIATLFEVARWRIAIQTTGEPFRLNNDFRSWYARKLMREVPDLDGVFELRRSVADEALGRAA